MQTKRYLLLGTFLAFWFAVPSARAYWIWSPAEGKFISPEAQGTQKTAEEQFEHALKLRESGKKVDEVVREFRKLVHQYPNSAYAPEAQFLIAEILEEQGKTIRAATEFQKVIREFPRSERVEQAMEHLFHIGNQFLTGDKQKVLGVAIVPVLSKASDLFRFIVEQAPYGSYGDRAQLGLGIAYRRMGNFEEAVKAFETLIANYPTSSLIDETHYQLAETSYELSQNASRDQRTLNIAAMHLKEFIQEYGTSTLAERAKILKARLDEQDAEKNYRIGLYYEKQGFIESAMIYYEDVSKRYPGTVYGPKATERLETLNQPAVMMGKGRNAIEQRLAEVKSLLQALDQEEEGGKDLKAQAASEKVQLLRELEVEFASLVLAQRRFQDEAREQFSSRRRAFRDREKNLREKLKIFQKRKKEFRKSDSPELTEAFEKWHASLVTEQDELGGERRALESLGLEVQGKKVSWTGWLPYFGEPKTPSEDRLLAYREKRWNELERERSGLLERRRIQEQELAGVTRILAELDQKEYEIARQVPAFQELVSDALKKQKAALELKRIKAEDFGRVFERARKEFETRYGTDAFKALGLELDRKRVASGAAESKIAEAEFLNGLVTGGADLEEMLRNLQREKLSLGEAWLAQKATLETLVKASGAGLNPSAPSSEEGVPPAESFSQEEKEKAARLLKKRMKYLEREVRSRMDEIEDWQRENAKRMEQLDSLLHPEKQDGLKLRQAAGKTWTLVSGTYKLGKAFVFGLPNRDRELVEEARQTVQVGGARFTADELRAIRELQEEIELQSILIQGRAQEIREFEGRLNDLRGRAKQIPDFEYQTLLLERFPSTLQHSIATARELLESGNQEKTLKSRIDHERGALEQLEKALSEMDRKIEAVGSALIQSRKSKFVSPVPGIVASIAGDSETTPTARQESRGMGSAELVDDERQALESKLMRLQGEALEARAGFDGETSRYEKTLFQWYQTEAREKLLPEFPSEGKMILDQKAASDERREKIDRVLASLVTDERQIAKSQKEFLDRKVSELEKRLSLLKDSSDLLRTRLIKAIKETAEKRNSLIPEISVLDQALNQ